MLNIISHSENVNQNHSKILGGALGIHYSLPSEEWVGLQGGVEIEKSRCNIEILEIELLGLGVGQKAERKEGGQGSLLGI